MPLTNFPEADTFVAYLDISGFKELMKREKGWKALDTFYSSGYRALQENKTVEGLFVSDCGVLFVRDLTSPILKRLESLLETIKKVNRLMRENDIMLTTSISYGPFAYHNRIEFPGIEKNPVYGNAYVSAVYDNEEGRPKLDPLQCRVVKEGLPISSDDFQLDNSYIFRLLKERTNDPRHYYFYWMVDEEEEIAQFEELYTDSYELKYSGMLKAAKAFSRHR